MNETKFDGKGKIYSQYRPSYPEAFIEYLYSDIGISLNSIIADIGAGTGILTKQLLERGNTVYAVEPNADMLKILHCNLSDYKALHIVNSSAEETTLERNSVDFITVAQAFHWFDRVGFKKECSQLLRQNGKVILVWNTRDCQSEIVRENDLVNEQYCPNYKGFSGGMSFNEKGNDFADFFTGEYECRDFRNDLQFNLESYIGRNLSASYALKESHENYGAYIKALENLFIKYSHNGVLTMPNITESFVGVVAQ